jgi:hypothetical protein
MRRGLELRTADAATSLESGATLSLTVVGRLGLLAVLLVLVIAGADTTRAADYRGVPLETATEVASGVGVIQPLDCRGRPIRYAGLTANGSGFLIGSRLVMTVEHGISNFLRTTRGVCGFVSGWAASGTR